MSWGLDLIIKELRAENADLKERLKQALLINEQRLDQIQDLKFALMEENVCGRQER